MPYLNIPESTLTSPLASQVGTLQGKYIPKIQSSSDRVRDLFNKGRVRSEKINRAKQEISNLKSFLESYNNRISKIQEVSPELLQASNQLSSIISTLKTLPIPGISLTAGATTTFSDTLNLIKEYSTQLQEDAFKIQTITQSGVESTNIIIQAQELISRADVAVELSESIDLIINLLSPEELTTIDSLIKNIITGTSEESLEASTKLKNIIEEKDSSIKFKSSLQEKVETSDDVVRTTIQAPNGESFTLLIKEVPSEFSLAPLRQAVAVDRNNVIRFSTESSFASDPSVLLQELKFNIINKLQ